MLNFDFLNKGLGIVPPAQLVYDFSTKMFLMLHSTNRPNFIAWLSLLLEILDFEINLIFLIEPFILHDQKVMTKT